MNHTTIELTPSKRDRALKPLFGGLAVLATVATLSLLVAAPAALRTADDTTLARRAPSVPTEVAIVPATIQVVGKRVRVARDEPGSFVPATYRSR